MIHRDEPEAVVTAIIIALVSVGCFAFVLFVHIEAIASQASESDVLAADVAGWETYSNNAYGFSVEYPPGWTLNTTGLNSTPPFVLIGNPISGLKTYALRIVLENNTSSLSSGEYVHDVLAVDRAEDAANAAHGPAPQITPQFQKGEILSVGTQQQYEAYELYGVFEFDHNAEQIYVAHGSFALAFDFPVEEENPNISLPVANNQIAHEIVNTLIFTK